jgi:hypothetical protein
MAKAETCQDVDKAKQQDIQATSILLHTGHDERPPLQQE